MNEVKHTPGPWFSYPDTVGSNVDIAVADKYGQVICDIGGAGLETRLANAQLIAAAPELLAIVKAEYDANNGFRTLPIGYPAERAQAIIAAIAKATGQ